MTHAVNRSLRAQTAIAAVLALSAISAAPVADAQEATPPVSLPQEVTAAAPAQASGAASQAVSTAPSAATSPPQAAVPMPIPSASPVAPLASLQPTVVLPDTPPPAVPVASSGEPEVRAPVRSTPRPAARTAAPVSPIRATAAPSVPTAQSSGTAADGTLAEGAVPPTAVPAVVPETRAGSEPRARDDANPASEEGEGLPLTGIAGLLAALGIAGLGVAAMRRRRQPCEHEDGCAAVDGAEAYEPVPVVDVAPAVTGGTSMQEPAGATTQDGGVNASSAFASSASVLAASPLPRTADERRDLLDRMVAAAPDEGNPFTSRKGRMRRARVQLQHLEHQAEREAVVPDAFDFRSYRPSTRAGGQAVPAKSDLIDA